ncbi:hypothetical protein BDQ17DRAFT_1298357 [Cyathus striatus]|nr:hypothetical protein BDQ17DRAFT_1298357 [Cyathus striatus]
MVAERSSLWFDDGNIVLQAGDTQFRVYRGMLTRHSTVFADMFSIPQPSHTHTSDDSDVVDGCPVVHLSDAAGDMEYVLSALFLNSFSSTRSQPLAVIAALLRLGRKYNFEKLQQDARAFLEKDIPKTFQTFRRRASNSRIISYPGVEFDIANIVHENQMNTLLPVALYDCLIYPMETIISGVTGEKVTKSATALSRLNHENQLRVALAKERMSTVRFKYSYGWASTEYASVFPARNCESLNSLICPTRSRSIINTIAQQAPLQPFLGLQGFDKLFFKSYLCDACLEVAEKYYEEGAEEMWDELPGYFNLDPWDKLQDDDVW